MSGLAELLAAIRSADPGAVEARLDAQPELVNARDERGNSPLLIATYHHRAALVRRLLDRGARPSFHEACAIGDDDVVRRHLAANPGRERERAHDGWTPLHLAAFFGHRLTAEILLETGADVLAVSRNDEENLPMNAAAAGRHVDIVRLLAAGNGDVELARFLLERGADRASRTGDGETALDLARRQAKPDVAALLGG